MSATPLIKPGAVLAGRWHILDFIGSGDLGEVYGVRDTHGSGTFALKLFWPSALGQAEVWTSMQKTARAASSLGVEGIARAYDFGIDANSARPFVVAERVPWPSLEARVRQSGPLSPADLAVALGVLSRALDAAHGAGLVHRDLKPENVFISADNPHWVRLSDFGAARFRSAAPPPPGWGGTIGWVPPDAADPNGESTPAMDVFSLTLVCFFALSGGALHRAARSMPIDPAALWHELGSPIDSASQRARELGASLDPAFDGWFQRAVSAMPGARFASVGEMASAFDVIVNGLAVSGTGTVLMPRTPRGPSAGVDASDAANALGAGPPMEPIMDPVAVPTFDAIVPAAALAPPAAEAQASAPPSAKKRGLAPLLIGGAVGFLGLCALGAVLYHHRRAAADEAVAEALASSSVAVAARAASAANAPSMAPTTSVQASAEPDRAPPSGADEKSASAAPVAEKPPAVTVAPKPPASTKPAPPSTSKAASTKVAATPSKPASASTKPAVSASTKPAVSAATKTASGSKPTAAVPVKRKCGSVFIPCK